MKVDIDKEEANEIVWEGLNNPPETSSGLYKFLTALTGEFIPFEPCCEGHHSPWDFIWYFYRQDIPKYRKMSKRNIVYVGPRAGYKTLSVAKLIVAEMLLKPGCEVAAIGAIEKHAKRIYQFVQKYLQHPVIVREQLIHKSLIEETVLANGNKYAQATATPAGVNGLHPVKLFLDEVDLWKEELVEEVRMAPKSLGDLDARICFVSTRKKEDGIMDNLIQNAFGKDYEVLISCYKDVSEPCTDERSGVIPRTYNLQDIYSPDKNVIVEAFDGCANCSLLPSCRGDLKRSRGIITIDDVITDWNNLERDTWIWQKECGRTRSSNLFFEYWDPNINQGNYKYRKDLEWVDMSFDFSGGGEDPTVVGFWQTDKEENDYLVAEKVYYKKLFGEIAKDLRTFVTEHGMSIRMQIGDSAAQQFIAELNNTDPELFQIKPTKKIHRIDGWRVLKHRIRDNNGKRRLFVDDSCQLFLHEVANAKKSQTDPQDIKKKQSDHSLDQARYRMVELYWFGNEGPPNIRILEHPSVNDKAKDGSKAIESAPGQRLNYLPRYLYGDDD